MKKLLAVLALMSIASMCSISYARVGVGGGVGVGRPGVAGRPVARAAAVSRYNEGQSGTVNNYPASYRGGARPVARAAVIRGAR